MKKTILLFLAFTAYCNISNAQWQETNSPYGGTITCITTITNNIYVGTASDVNGGVFVTSNSGNSWIYRGLYSKSIRGLISSGTNLFAGTGSDGVLFSVNAGSLWNPVNTGMTSNIVYALAINGNNIYAGTYGGIFVSTNNGNNWTATGPANGIYSLVTNGNSIFAGSSGGVYMSLNNGSSWSTTNLPGSSNIISFAVNDSNIYAGSTLNGVYLSTNYGSSWNAVNNGLPANTEIRSIALIGDTIFAGTYNRGVYLSLNKGNNWYAANSGILGLNVNALSIIGTNIFAATSNGVWKRAISDFFGRSVWPGDANNDSIVNNNDLLPIGLYYGTSGIIRDSISNLWVGHNCIEWTTFQTNLKNKKHADCNGDGVINFLDTVAINLNYGLNVVNKKKIIHTKKTAVTLSIVPSSSSYNAGDTARFDIIAGDISTPVNSLYGIAYDVNVDPTFIKSGTLKFTNSSSWLGNPISEALSLSKKFESTGNIENAIIRTDHNNQTGYGKIGELEFVVNPNLTSVDTMLLSISYYNAVNAAGQQVLFTVVDTSSLVYPIITSLSEMSSASFTIYPNPANNKIEISTTENSEIEILNIEGEIIKSISSADNNATIDISSFARGMYFVKMKNGNGLVVKKFIKE